MTEKSKDDGKIGMVKKKGVWTEKLGKKKETMGLLE